MVAVAAGPAVTVTPNPTSPQPGLSHVKETVYAPAFVAEKVVLMLPAESVNAEVTVSAPLPPAGEAEIEATMTLPTFPVNVVQVNLIVSDPPAVIVPAAVSVIVSAEACIP